MSHRKRRRQPPPPTATVITDPWLVDKIASQGTPVGQAMHEYNQALMDRALTRTTATTPQETDMPEIDPEELLNAVQALDNRLRDAETKIAEQGKLIEELREKVDPQPKRDELAEALLSWLNAHPCIFLSPTAVWINCGGLDVLGVNNDRIADKLAMLAKRGLVDMRKDEGRNALYAGKVQP